MGVYRLRRTGSWRYDFLHQRRRYTGAGYPTMRAARAAEELHRREVSLGLSADISTFGALVDVFLSSSLRTKSQAWVYQLTLKLNKGFGHLARMPLAKLRRVHFEQALTMLHDSGSSAGTVNEYRKIVHSVISYGVKNEILLRNPVTGIPTMPTDIAEAVTISTDNLRRLVQAADPNTRALVIFLSQTGARSVEAFRLRWTDVVFTDDDPHCFLSTRKVRGGHEERRRQPLTRTAVEALRAERDTSSVYVFAGPSGGRLEYQTARNRLVAACDAAGINRIGFHALRHWVGYVAASSGASIKAAARVLGHKSAAITERYLHATEAERLEIVQQLEQQLIGDEEQSEEGFTHRV